MEKATAWVDNKSLDFLDKAHFEIAGPSGHILNCDDFLNLLPGHRSPDCSWEPYADVPAGRYCAKLWYITNFPEPHWTQLGISTCIDVHT